MVYGFVQGVGFRPHVYALATDLLLSGAVSNTADGVEIAPTAHADSFTASMCTSTAPIGRPVIRPTS